VSEHMERSTASFLMDKREGANLLGISVRMIDYLIKDGQLKVRRIGRRVLLHREELRNFARREK